MAKIVPHLWYAKEAEEAAKFYASTFPNSKVDRVSTVGAETPSGPAGSVKVIELTLMGQAFMLLQAGPHADFNDAVSFLIPCDDQAEIDRLVTISSKGSFELNLPMQTNDILLVRFDRTGGRERKSQ